MQYLKTIISCLCLGLLIAACATTTPSGFGPTDTPLATPPATSTAMVVTQIPALVPSPSSTPQGTWIQLTPNAGPPGTKVHIDGYLPDGFPQTELAPRDYTTYASICWGGCLTGLEEDGLLVTWSQKETGYFGLEFTVPPIPWLSSDGFHSLEAGEYAVDLINLDFTKAGCAAPDCPEAPIASATFHLTQSASYPACKEPNCGSLVASPASAAPGETVQVTGWAPLVQYIGGPFGYNLVLEPQGSTVPADMMYLAVQQSEAVLQAEDGSLTASFRVPQFGSDGSALAPGSYTLALEAFLPNVNMTYTALVAPTPFTIKPAPAWDQLPQASPLWVQPASDVFNLTLTADLLNPKRLAYCAAGKIELSQDAGQSWASIPVDANLPVPLERLTAGTGPATCISVSLDSSHPDSLYAVFSLMDKEYGAPPVYFMGYYTTDLGKTWQLVPLPDSIDLQSITNGFAGFWTDGSTVQVLYNETADNGNYKFPPLAKQTLDGGATWTDAPLACPATGPCVRWGSAPGFVGGMGAELPQEVLASPDGGKTWVDTGQSVELRNTGPRELVALSDNDVLLISGTDRFPLRYSSDGGESWQVIGLPSAISSHPGYFVGYPGMQIDPGGGLFSMLPDSGQWMSLPPGGASWCPLSFATTNLYPPLLHFLGTKVLWLSGATLQPETAPQREFICP